MIFDVKAIEGMYVGFFRERDFIKHVREVDYLHSSILSFMNLVALFVDVCLFCRLNQVWDLSGLIESKKGSEK